MTGCRRGLLIKLLACLSTGLLFVPVANAGLDVAPALPDLSGYATQAEVPRGCLSSPSPDTLNGSPGSVPCYVSSDATRPTSVQAANVITDSSGNWSVTWARPFNSSTPVINPLPVNTGTLPILCNVVARSASGASGKCWQSTTNTLPGTLASIGGMVVNPFGTTAGSAAVMIIGREPTQ